MVYGLRGDSVSGGTATEHRVTIRIWERRSGITSSHREVLSRLPVVGHG